MNKMNLLAADRYEICKGCENFNETFKSCKLCGCFMPAKVLLKSSKCPDNKWGEDKGEDNG